MTTTFFTNMFFRYVFPYQYELIDLGITESFEDADKIAQAVKRTGQYGEFMTLAFINQSKERVKIAIPYEYDRFLELLGQGASVAEFALAFVGAVNQGR